MGTLNDKTIEKRETIKNAGYKHISTYECQLAKNKDFQKFANLEKTSFSWKTSTHSVTSQSLVFA